MATNDASESSEIEALRRQVGELQLELKRKEDQRASIAPYSKSFSRTMIVSILESETGGVSMTGQTIRVGGWVKTGRTAGGGAFAFLELNDGSCFANLQVMVDKEVGDAVGGLKELTSTATCVLVEGQLAETPEGTKQKVCFWFVSLIGCLIGPLIGSLSSESGAQSSRAGVRSWRRVDCLDGLL